jgi:hypothetical protein
VVVVVRIAVVANTSGEGNTRGRGTSSRNIHGAKIRIEFCVISIMHMHAQLKHVNLILICSSNSINAYAYMHAYASVRKCIKNIIFEIKSRVNSN